MTKISKTGSLAQELDFESTVEKLKTVIDILEKEDASLQDMLSAFEEGVMLVGQAEVGLREAEQRVQLLLAKDRQPFADEFKEEKS